MSDNAISMNNDLLSKVGSLQRNFDQTTVKMSLIKKKDYQEMNQTVKPKIMHDHFQNHLLKKFHKEMF